MGKDRQNEDDVDAFFATFGEIKDKPSTKVVDPTKSPSIIAVAGDAVIASVREKIAEPIPILVKENVQADPVAQAWRIGSALSKYGTSTIHTPTNTPENICICIQQNHGSVETLIQDSPEQTQLWLHIQQETIHMLTELVQEVGSENILFFIEGFQDNYPADRIPADFLKTIDESCTKGCYDISEAAEISSRLKKMDPPFRENIHSLMAAMYGFAIKKLRFHELKSDQVYGFTYPGREEGRAQRLAVPHPTAFFRSQTQDNSKLHEALLLKLKEKLGKGKVGVVLLGGAHFATVKNIQEASRYGDENQVQRLMDVSVETYLAKMDATVTMIMEPLVYKNWQASN